MRSIGLALVAALLAATPAAAQEVSIYSSLPLTGPQGSDGRDVLRGERLALEQAGGRAGAFTVRLVSHDAALRGHGAWDPARVFGNARRAVEDPSAIAYLGE
jgi:branched-chain amino acid transport system substrate-binding protein